MRAVVVERWTEPAELRVGEIPEPTLRPGTLLVEVRAAGCNFFDILMVQGRYQVKPPFPFVPGGELAGRVVEVGEGVQGFAAGDRILAGVPLGGFAERAVVPARSAHRLPEAMSFEEGAAFPIVYPTSWAGLVWRARLEKGETVLIHAAAGGVGLAAVQIAKALGARVLATAGGAEKCAVAREAGADETIDYASEDFVERVRVATDGRGADVIYDSVGGDVFDRSLRCLAWNGRILVVGFASGSIPSVALNRILLKNVSVVGLHWGAYASHEPERVPEAFAALFELYRAGRVRPTVQRTYPLEGVAEALADLASRRSHGKLVLVP